MLRFTPSVPLTLLAGLRELNLPRTGYRLNTGWHSQEDIGGRPLGLLCTGIGSWRNWSLSTGELGLMVLQCPRCTWRHWKHQCTVGWLIVDSQQFSCLIRCPRNWKKWLSPPTKSKEPSLFGALSSPQRCPVDFVKRQQTNNKYGEQGEYRAC